MRFNVGENSRMALNTVREHKARSFLTVLGVVIGVAAMIFVASILVGVNKSIEDYLNDYGTNTLFVFRFDVGIRTGRLTAEERARKPLTLDDAKAIHGRVPTREERHRRGDAPHCHGRAAANPAYRALCRPRGQ